MILALGAATSSSPRLHLPTEPADALVVLAVAFVTFALGARAMSPRHAALLAVLGLIAYGVIGNAAVAMGTALVAAGLLARRYTTASQAEADVPPVDDLVVELTKVLGALGIYTLARYVIETDASPAEANTDRIISFERSLHLFVEPDIQSWVLDTRWVIEAFNWMYSFGFLAVVAAVLLWLWATDGVGYRALRNSLGISAVLALVIIVAFPATPPRLTPSTGLVDTVIRLGGEHTFVNEYAAVPSLHAAWPAAAGYLLGRRWPVWAQVLACLVPGAVMMTTVIATGNHFWLDGAVGMAITLGPAVAFAWHARAGDGPELASAVTRDATGSAVRHKMGPSGR